MIFELCVKQCTKADMVKHGEYAPFLPSKFEKNEKKCKIMDPQGFKPQTTAWKSGVQSTRPRRQIKIRMDFMLYEYVKK